MTPSELRAYARYGEQAWSDALDGPDGPARWAELYDARPGLLAALEAALHQEEDELGGELFIAHFNLWMVAGPVDEGIALGERLLARAALSPLTRARVLRAQGNLLLLAGRLAESWQTLDAAERVTVSLGDPALLARLWLSVAIWYQERGEPGASLPVLERAIALPGVPERLLGFLHTARATSAYTLGDHAGALAQDTQALVLHRAAGNLRMEALTLTNIALKHLDADRRSEALRALDEALPLARRIGNRRSETDARRILAAALIEARAEDVEGPRADRGARIAEALEHADAAVAALVEMGQKRLESLARGARADVLVAAGRLEEAREEAGAALRIATEIGHRRNEGLALARRAAIALRLGEMELFRAEFAAAEERLQGPELRANRVVAWTMRGQAELDNGEDAEARACLRRAVELAELLPGGDGTARQAIQRLKWELDGD